MKKYRKYMLLAYEEMLKSNNYHNSDKYQAPLVGCLLLFNDGDYVTAHRDESAEYKHAENILINKIDINKIDDDSILFVTLEPCIPFIGRNHLLSCCELIVKNKIKNVCIGMVDPNPNIKEKGIKFLKDNNVNISFFDDDITEMIYKANKNFIEFIKKEKRKN